MTMTTTDENFVIDFERSFPRDAAALWAQLTDGIRISVTPGEAVMLYRKLVRQRLAADQPDDATGTWSWR